MSCDAPELTDRWWDLSKAVLAIFVVASGLNAVVPLFPLYEVEFGLASRDITLMYAVYGLALVPALLIFGATSDAVGRIVIIVPAMAVFAGASLLFAYADGLALLIIARILQGIGNGAVWSVCAALVMDMVSNSRRNDGALIVSTTLPAGIALGAAGFGLAASAGLVEQAWIAHAVLVAGGAVLVGSVRDRVPRTGGIRVRLTLPADHRSTFLQYLAPVTFGTVGAVGMVTALLPSYLARAGIDDVTAITGIALAAFILLIAIVQPATRAVGRRLAVFLGIVLVFLPLVILVAATERGVPGVVFLALALFGLGAGLALRGTFATAEAMTTPVDRAGVIAAFTVAQYLGLSVPALISGPLVDAWGLAMATAAVGGVCAVIATIGYLRRPDEPARQDSNSPY